MTVRGANWALFAAIVGSSMVFIDGTAVNVALPVLQHDLRAGSEAVQWVIEGYSLFLAALMLIGGSLGDHLGRKKIFGAGIALFAIASLTCALSPTIETLIAARCLQGIGGALATPGSLALIASCFSGAARGRAIGTWSATSALTAAIGPLLGGWLVQVASWRFVFLINLPLALLVLYALRFPPESRDEEDPTQLDYVGAALATIGLGALTFGLIRLQGAALDVPGVWCVGVGIATLIGFAFYEDEAREPMVPLGLFRSRSFTVANLYTLLLYAALGGSFYFVPFDLINVQGYSPEAAGAALLPFVVTLSVFSRFSGGLVARIGARTPLALGAVLAAVGFAGFGLAGIGRSYWVSFFPAGLILGIGACLFVAPLTTTVMDSVSEAHAGTASGINNAVSRVAGLIAIAALGIALAMAAERSLNRELAREPGVTTATRAVLYRERDRVVSGRIPDEITDPAQRRLAREAIDRAYLAGFQVEMFTGAGLALLAGILAFAFLPARET